MTHIKILFSGMIFFQLLVFVICSVLEISSFEHNLKTISFESVACINAMFLQFISTYALCHFSTNLTTKSTKMFDAIYNTTWYSLPLQQQKMITPMIRQGQTPFVLNGFNIISCSKETFVMVFILKPIKSNL